MNESDIYVQFDLIFLSSEIRNDGRVYFTFAVDKIGTKPEIEVDLPLDSWVLSEPRDKCRQWILDKAMQQVVAQYHARNKIFEVKEIIHCNKSIWPDMKKEKASKS